MIAKNKIDEVIKLAQERERAYDINPEQDYNGLNTKLEAFLNSLSFDDIKSLQAIMYLGRDKDYDNNLAPQQIYNSQYDYFDKTLGWNTKELEINQMVEKMPLATYLIEAKKILNL